MKSVVCFPAGGEGEEDERHGGADEGNRTVAAERQAAAEGEGRSAEGPGQNNLHV